MNELEAARWYAKRGWRVFPLNGKVPLISREDGGRGVLDATTDDEQIADWFLGHLGRNIGVATGRESGIWVLDVDEDKGGDDTLAQLVAEHGELPLTYVVETPHGRHYYWRWLEGTELRNSAGSLGKGLDTRGEGGYVVAPPSQVGGTAYQAWSDSETVEYAPEWLVKLATTRPERASVGDERSLAADGALIETGQRNATLVSLAGSMRRRGMEQVEIEAALLATNKHRVMPPLAEDEVREIARKVSHYDPEPVPKGRTRPLVQRADLVAREYIEFAANPQGRQRLGWESLDARLRGGIAPGELGVLAAAPYAGKTTMLANIAVNNPTTPMVFASIEMTLILVAARMFAMMTGEEYRTLEERIKSGNRRLRERILAELGDGLPLLGLIGVGGPSVKTLSRAMADYRDEFQVDPKLVMIDYLDLMSPPSLGVEAVKQKLVDLRQFAKDEELGTLVAHQLKRDAYDVRPGQPLGFTDTRYGGETEADHLVGIHRRVNDPRVQENPRLLAEHRRTLNYQVLKTRSDETVGAIVHELAWNPDTLRITEPNGETLTRRRAAAHVFAEDDRQDALWSE